MNKVKFAFKFSLNLIIILSFLTAIKSASFAATFFYTPQNGNLNINCIDKIDIKIDATNQSANAAEIKIKYDANQINILDQNPNQDGVQILEGDAFESYIVNKVDLQKGEINLAGISYQNYLTSQKTFGTIKFSIKEGVTKLDLTTFFIQEHSTIDSNIADSSTSLDILTTPQNASYTFVNESCEADTLSPVIKFINIINNQEDVDVNTEIIFEISDNASDLNLENLNIIIDSETIDINDPRLMYTKDGLTYRFIFKPQKAFSYGKKIIVSVSGEDINGNKFTGGINFTTKKEDSIVPDKPGDNSEEGNEDNEELPKDFSNFSVLQKFLIFLLIPLFILLAFILLRKNKKALVYEFNCKKPLEGILVEVLDLDNNLIAASTSDLKGNYNIIISTAGNYYLNIGSDEYRLEETFNKSILIKRKSKIRLSIPVIKI